MRVFEVLLHGNHVRFVKAERMTLHADGMLHFENTASGYSQDDQPKVIVAVFSPGSWMCFTDSTPEPTEQKAA